MAKGDWWLKLDIHEWLNDPRLRRLRRENRDSWLTACLMMRLDGEYQITGAAEELANLLHLTPDEFTAFVDDLKRTNVADVTRCNDFVTLLSRRYQREAKCKEDTRLRVQKLRGNADVTPMKRDRVISKSKSKKKEEEIREEAAVPLAVFLGTIEAGLSDRLGIKNLPNQRVWHEKLTWAFNNNFTIGAVLECYDLLKTQDFWQARSISAKTLIENLANLPALRTNGHRNGHVKETYPTPDQKKADDEANSAAMKLPPKESVNERT